jgi:hypothetical protein
MATDKIIWHNSKIYDHNTMVKRVNFVKSNMNGLLPLCNNEKVKIISYAKQNNIPLYEMICLRNTIRIQKEIDASKKIHSMSDTIKKKFEILAMQLTNESGNHEKKIRNWLMSTRMPIRMVIKMVSKMSDLQTLSATDLEYINKINNCITKTDIEIFKRSVDFENQLEYYLKSLNIKFRTENDIKRDKDYTVTPDILFDDTIIIEVNGIDYTIKWMDAKNYVLMDTPFIIKSLNKQATKYNNIFGLGAFVFHYGFDSSIKIPNVLILDGSML